MIFSGGLKATATVFPLDIFTQIYFLDDMIKKQFDVIKKSFTFKRLWNLSKVMTAYGLSLLTKKPIVWGYPPILMIEPTNICNLKCPLCPSGADNLTRKKGFMDYATFTKIIDEVADYTFMLILWNQGEPFLHSDFLKMLSYAHQKRLYLMVSTNANLMPPAQKLIETGIDLLIVSLDGATQESYNLYRRNGSLPAVLQNVTELVKAKKALGCKYPTVVWQFLVMRHNEHEIEQIKQLSAQTEVDMLVFKTVQIYSREDIEKYLPTNPHYCRYKLVKSTTDPDAPLDFILPTFKNRCYRIWFQPVINWDGQMSVCCFDKDIVYKIGNVSTKTVYKLYQSTRFNNFRRVVLRDRKRFEICRNCGEGTSLQIKP